MKLKPLQRDPLTLLTYYALASAAVPMRPSDLTGYMYVHGFIPAQLNGVNTENISVCLRILVKQKGVTSRRLANGKPFRIGGREFVPSAKCYALSNCNMRAFKQESYVKGALPTPQEPKK